MSTTQEAKINPDGTFETPPINESNNDGFEGDEQQQPGFDEDASAALEAKGIDPALYVIGAFVLFIIVYYFFVYRKKKAEESDEFFSSLDGEKFNIKLPAEVDEYYAIKEKCEAAGWEAGKGGGGAAELPPNHPQRIMAQALMKRAIADIPIVQHIQKESAGMNKLYSQSMCSVTQWRSYQAAEHLVSSEVEDVRAEADEIEPGWSQVIWRQAMQYHQMLKQKHEMEAKAAEEQAKKRKEIEERVKAAKSQMSAEDKELAAQRAAEELIKAEEREKESKKSFSSGGMKKGFLDSKGKKK